MTANDWQTSPSGHGAYAFKNGHREPTRENVLLRVEPEVLADRRLLHTADADSLRIGAVVGSDRVLLGAVVGTTEPYVFVDRRVVDLEPYAGHTDGEPDGTYGGSIDGVSFSIRPWDAHDDFGLVANLREQDGTEWSAIWGYQVGLRAPADSTWPITEHAFWNPPPRDQSAQLAPVQESHTETPMRYELLESETGESLGAGSEDELYALIRGMADDADKSGLGYDTFEARLLGDDEEEDPVAIGAGAELVARARAAVPNVLRGAPSPPFSDFTTHLDDVRAGNYDVRVPEHEL